MKAAVQNAFKLDVVPSFQGLQVTGYVTEITSCCVEDLAPWRATESAVLTVCTASLGRQVSLGAKQVFSAHRILVQ